MATKKVVKKEVEEKAVVKKPAVKKTPIEKAKDVKEAEKIVRKPRKKPTAVAVVDTASTTPTTRKVPLVPVQDGNTLAVNSLFARLDLTIQTDKGEKNVKSGFLLPDRSLDLLALSMNGDWLNEGLIKEDDKIAPEVNLKALAICIDGVNSMLELRPQDHVFVSPPNTSFMLKELKSTIIHKAGSKRTIIMIEAQLDLSSGRIFLRAITPEWLTVTGYMLDAFRVVS